MLSSKYKFLLWLTAFALMGGASIAAAQEWHLFKSETNLFSVRIPDNIQEDIKEFRLGPRRVTQTGQSASTIDQRPLKDAVKNYIIKYEQTLGTNIVDDDLSELIASELDIYENYYKKLKGDLRRRNEIIQINGAVGGEIQIAYEDPALGPQHIRARVFFTRSGKVQQIVTGPPNIIDSIPTRHYFESLRLHEGYKHKVGSFKEDWPAVKSQLGIFTAYLPEKTKPYVPKDVEIKNSDNAERVAISFRDPIWKETVFYNIYGYQLGQDLNYLNVEKFLRKNHVLRHVFKDGLIEFDKLTNEDAGMMETEYIIEAPEKFPYVTTVKLRALFSGDHLLVHEVMGSPRLVRSTFMKKVVESVEFHAE